MTSHRSVFEPLTKKEARRRLQSLRLSSVPQTWTERRLRESEVDCWAALEYVQTKFEQEIRRIKDIDPESPVEVQARKWDDFITLLLKESLYNPSGSLLALSERVTTMRDELRFRETHGAVVTYSSPMR